VIHLISSRRVVLAGLGVSALALATGLSGASRAQNAGEVNLYSSRHYDTDEALYTDFTKLTGIKVNRLEGREDEILQRMKAEGDKSPADILITVDAGRLWRAQSMDLLQPFKSALLEQAIPAHLREPNGYWYGFSRRARVLVVNPERVNATDIKRYEDLADPKWKGRVLVRSSTNVYNQSLVGSMIANDGEAQTEAWARGIVANMARPPKGGDTDQIKAVAAGEGDVALSNTYYIARILGSSKPEDKEDPFNAALFGKNNEAALKLMDRAGWK